MDCKDSWLPKLKIKKKFFLVNIIVALLALKLDQVATDSQTATFNLESSYISSLYYFTS